MPKLKRPAVIVATLATAVFLAGCEFSCSTGNTVSSEELGKQVQESYENQTNVGLTSIDCEQVDAEVGEKISCQATNESDVSLEITGTVTEYDSDSDEIRFDWKVASATTPGATYAPGAQRGLLRQSGVRLTDFQCPDEVDIRKGNTFECTATDVNGNERTVEITLTDGSGGFSAVLLQLPAQ